VPKGTVVTLDLPDFFTLRRFERVESTNSTAKLLAQDKAPEGTLVVSGEQTKGRGRSGRDWASPPGNLYLSLLLRPHESAAVAAQHSFVAALSVHDFIAPLLRQHDLKLKWPNDVLVDGRKVCGILLESATAPDGGLAWLIIGIGINVASVPSVVAETATCLHDLGCGDVKVDDCLAGFSVSLWRWLERWRLEGFAPIRSAWLSRCGALEQALRVRAGGEQFDGVFEDLDEEGALIVKLPNGGFRRITAGEVFFADRQSG
jgi:BirA family biotin operon repressor/biotin-[acetyl-CoA-carboxylase] ligase